MLKTKQTIPNCNHIEAKKCLHRFPTCAFLIQSTIYASKNFVGGRGFCCGSASDQFTECQVQKKWLVGNFLVVGGLREGGSFSELTHHLNSLMLGFFCKHFGESFDSFLWFSKC